MKKTFRHNKFTAEFSDEGTGPGNRYFSFTGEMNGSSGAMGDRIAKVFPAFQVFEDLHLAKLSGEPMHALENGFYHFKGEGWKVEALESYWKVKFSDEQKKALLSPMELSNSFGGESILSFPDLPESHQKRRVADIMEEIRPRWAEKVKRAYALAKSTPSDLTEIDETVNINDFNEPGKVRALAAYLDVHFSTIEEDGTGTPRRGSRIKFLPTMKQTGHGKKS